MHKLAKQIAECLKSNIESIGIENFNGKNLDDLKDWTEIIKNIVCYDKYYRIIEAMGKAEKEDEESEKYFIKMLKEEYGMEDEEEARRFYRGQPRSKTSGRFMRRGDGRRSYTPYYHMTPEMYHEHEPEYYRDMDRSEGRMYYSGSESNPRLGGMERANSTSAGRNRSYYGGESGRDSREGRSGMSRRSYMETKETHSGNSAEEKQQKMKELEKYMSELGADITEMISDASNEEKTLLKNKLQVLAQKVV